MDLLVASAAARSACSRHEGTHGAWTTIVAGGLFSADLGLRIPRVLPGGDLDASGCPTTRGDRRFAFDVAAGPVPVARWDWEMAPYGEAGTELRVSWTDRRTGPLGWAMRHGGRAAVGATIDRAHTQRNIDALESLRAPLTRAWKSPSNSGFEGLCRNDYP